MLHKGRNSEECTRHSVSIAKKGNGAFKLQKVCVIKIFHTNHALYFKSFEALSEEQFKIYFNVLGALRAHERNSIF